MIKICIFCKKEFNVKPSHYKRRKCCSIECFSNLRKKNRTISCAYCGKDFDPLGFKDQKYCSRKCMGITKRNPVKYCPECNKPIKTSNWKYCSKECYSKSMIGNPGNHVFWDTATESEKLERLVINYNRFVIKRKGCWGWSGSKLKKYKSVQYNGKSIDAHRASWIIYKGPIPDGMFICHKCDNPACTNPDHLFLGTPTDNVHDMHKKGRANILKGELAPSSKLTNNEVKEIKKLLRNKTCSDFEEVAKKYRVHTRTISDIYYNKTWKSIKF